MIGADKRCWIGSQDDYRPWNKSVPLSARRLTVKIERRMVNLVIKYSRDESKYKVAKDHIGLPAKHALKLKAKSAPHLSPSYVNYIV